MNDEAMKELLSRLRFLETGSAARAAAGEIRIVDSNSFKASTNIAMAMVTLRPSDLRELH